MKPWLLTLGLLGFVSTQSTQAISSPNSTYPSAISLFEKEVTKQKSRLQRWPISASRWKHYQNAKKMLRLFQASQDVADTNYAPKTRRISTRQYKRSYRIVHEFLFDMQQSLIRSLLARDGMRNVNPGQAQLDDRIRDMNPVVMAKLLSDANSTIPQTCGEPDKGIAHTGMYNLRYKIRNVSIENNTLSQLETQIVKELVSMDIQPEPDLFPGVEISKSCEHSEKKGGHLRRHSRMRVSTIDEEYEEEQKKDTKKQLKITNSQDLLDLYLPRPPGDLSRLQQRNRTHEAVTNALQSLDPIDAAVEDGEEGKEMESSGDDEKSEISDVLSQFDNQGRDQESDDEDARATIHQSLASHRVGGERPERKDSSYPHIMPQSADNRDEIVVNGRTLGRRSAIL